MELAYMSSEDGYTLLLRCKSAITHLKDTWKVYPEDNCWLM